MSPVFIFGIGRSGTTLLARMLDLHPNLSIYLESGFLNLLTAEATTYAAASEGEVAHLLDRMADPAAQGVPRAALTSRFATTDRSMRALFDTLLRLRMETRGKRRYGEKTPSHFTKVDVLRAWYPDARFVYLHRDPRDAYASFKHSAAHRELAWSDRTLLGRCLYWNFYRHALQDARRRFPSQVHEVELEALVRDPETTLRSLCAFLGEPYEASMLAVTENNSSFAETRSASGLRPETIDRKGRLNRFETTLIELLCGEHMRADGLRLSAATRRIVPLLARLGFYAFAVRLHRALRSARGHLRSSTYFERP